MKKDQFGMIEHSVRGRLVSDGSWVHIAPELTSKTGGWWIFKYTWRCPIKKLRRLKAIEVAKESFASGKYQDVLVLQDGGNDSSGEALCPICIWKNGRWCEYWVDTGLYV